MTLQEASLYAATGDTVMLPGWKGYFVWDYANKEMIFKNGDYKLTSKQLIDKGLDKRTDFYYII